MKSNIRSLLSATILTVAMASGGASAMVHIDEIGTLIDASRSSVDRVINVDASTRWLNVSYGETVRITVGGDAARSVVFRFDGNATSATLGDIAPALPAGRNLAVYINQQGNPMVSAPQG